MFTYFLMKKYNWFGVNDNTVDPMLEAAQEEVGEKMALLSKQDVEHGHSHAHGHSHNGH